MSVFGQSDARSMSSGNPTLSEIELASSKSKKTSYPVRWRKNIFRKSDRPEKESAALWWFKGGTKKAWNFYFWANHASERYLSAISLAKKLPFTEENPASFLIKCVGRERCHALMGSQFHSLERVICKQALKGKVNPSSRQAASRMLHSRRTEKQISPWNVTEWTKEAPHPLKAMLVEEREESFLFWNASVCVLFMALKSFPPSSPSLPFLTKQPGWDQPLWPLCFSLFPSESMNERR